MKYPKLNELVATKVMGWTLEEDHDLDGLFYALDGNYAVSRNRWNPATDLNSAFEVIEEAAGGIQGIWSVHPVSAPDVHFAAEISQPWNLGNKKICGLHNQLSIAICICSLRACNVPETEIAAALENKP